MNTGLPPNILPDGGGYGGDVYDYGIFPRAVWINSLGTYANSRKGGIWVCPSSKVLAGAPPTPDSDANLFYNGQCDNKPSAAIGKPTEAVLAAEWNWHTPLTAMRPAPAAICSSSPPQDTCPDGDHANSDWGKNHAGPQGGSSERGAVYPFLDGHATFRYVSRAMKEWYDF